MAHANRFTLCRLAARTARRLHRPGDRMAETIKAAKEMSKKVLEGGFKAIPTEPAKAQ